MTHITVGLPDAAARGDILALLAHVEEADGVAAVGEEALLELSDPRRPAVKHLRAYDGDTLAGYAWTDGDGGELAVEPGVRRCGHGTTLLRRLLGERAATAVWAHGTLPAAVALATATGLTATRVLLQMRWEVTDGATSQSTLPDGLAARAFTGTADGLDGRGWVDLNARVFADHPEQGRLTGDDLARRIAEPWFDARLFTLVHEGGTLVAYCWLKPGPAELEVYVIGVDSEHQRRGIAAHLLAGAQCVARQRGAQELTLYVEGDNLPALRSYVTAGFAVGGTDTQFARR